jgi:hypothetical protein
MNSDENRPRGANFRKTERRRFFRLVQQAVDTGPTAYAHIAKPAKLLRTR